jgi:quercetin dioxygenase-like cupin family protein
MRKLDFKEIETSIRSGGIFTGEVELQRIIHKDMGAKGLSVTFVHFPPGIRNTWHTHNYEQCLWILNGKGIVASEKEEHIAEEGMAFFIPPREKHWHGALDEIPFSHISIIGGEARIT